MSDFTTINPATGETIDTYVKMSDAEASAAVDKCHEAFTKWRRKSTEERADILRGIGKALDDNKDELAHLMSLEMGKLKKHSIQEVELCSAICQWTADNGPGYLKEETRDLMSGERGIISYSPIGVIYGIQPWNFPSYQVVRYSIANLMAGNGVLLKHSSNVLGSARMLERIYQQGGLPEDLFTLLVIDHDQSDDIIAHDKVRGVTLTGSPAAGAHVGEKAGKLLKKSVLELGSNDAYIVLGDADIDLAVKMCVQGRVYNNGETCVAAKRFIAVDSVYEKFRDAYVEAMQSLTVGDPFDDETDLGPMAREDLRDDLHEQVTKSVDGGARVLCGGEMPDGKGFFYPATVIDKAEPGTPAYDEELFGPVATLIRAKDDEDAMRIANDSPFGLGGGIFSADVDRAIKLAQEEFDTGMVFVNGFGLAQPMMPFGGVKNSGYGREHGGEGVREFTNIKSVFVMDE